VLGRADFEVATALLAHRKVLTKNFTRTRQLIQTIDKTVKHLKVSTRMSAEEIFRGFKVTEGKDRFDERIEISGDLAACKVSAQDTHGAMCVFEFTGGQAGPRHLHHDQDEWMYIIEGEFDVEIGGQLLRAHPGDTVFLPRKVAHGWMPVGKMDDFFREVGRFTTTPIHEVLGIEGMVTLFKSHGMELSGAPLSGQWHVDEQGRIHRLA